MRVRIIFTRYYEYEVEGTDLDDCFEIAEDELNRYSRSPIAESDYDEVDYEIIEDNEEEETEDSGLD